MTDAINTEVVRVLRESENPVHKYAARHIEELEAEVAALKEAARARVAQQQMPIFYMTDHPGFWETESEA